MNQLLKWMIVKKRLDYESRWGNRQLPFESFDEITESHNVPYLKDGHRAHTLDIYIPNGFPDPLPVIVYIHGGELITGRKEDSSPFCLKLCQRGFLVISVGYRLCPETTVFGQLQDIASAMNDIYVRIPPLKGTPGSAYLVADGGGAFLALYTVAIQRNPMLAKLAGIHPSKLEIRSMALISGMFYTTRPDRIGVLFPRILYGDHCREQPIFPYWDPEISAVSMSVPPCMIITSRNDALHSYSIDMASALRNAKTPCILKDYGDAPALSHAFPVFNPYLPESIKVQKEITDFFLSKHKQPLRRYPNETD